MACVNPEELCDSIAEQIIEKRGNLIAIYPSKKLGNTNSLGVGSFGAVRSAIVEIDLSGEAFACISAYKITNRDPSKAKRSYDIFIMKDILMEIASYARLQSYENVSKGLFAKLGDTTNIVMAHYVMNCDELINMSLPVKIILCIVYQILHGLSNIHKENIIHRDIKPENIFVSQDGTVCVGDFGLVTNIPVEFDKLLDHDTFVGSRFYKPPESFYPEEIGDRSYNNTFDIWAVGTMLFNRFKKKEVHHLYRSLYGNTEKPSGEAPVQEDINGLLDDFLSADKLIKITSEAQYESMRNLIGKLLKVNPEERYTAEQALSHECFRLFGITLETAKATLSEYIGRTCYGKAYNKRQGTKTRANAMRNDDSASFFRIEKDMEPWRVSKNPYRTPTVLANLEMLNPGVNMGVFIQTFLHAVELFDRVLIKTEDQELEKEHVDNLFNTCLYLANVIAEFRLFSGWIDDKMKRMIVTKYITFVIKALQGDIFALKEGLVTEVMRQGRHGFLDTIYMVDFRRYPVLGLEEAANANNALAEIGQLSPITANNANNVSKANSDLNAALNNFINRGHMNIRGGARKTSRRRSKSVGKASRRRRSR